MSRSARVTSIGVLQTMVAALQRFRGEGASVLDDLEIAIHRAQEWIHHDRKDYWARELRLSWEAVSAARLQLRQAQTSRRIAGHEPSCIDEKRVLDRAKRRLEVAEQKVKAVKHWELAIDRAVDEFQRSRTHFATWLETDLIQAVAALNRMSESLERYVSLETPSATDSAIDTGPQTPTAAEPTPDAESREAQP